MSHKCVSYCYIVITDNTNNTNKSKWAILQTIINIINTLLNNELDVILFGLTTKHTTEKKVCYYRVPQRLGIFVCIPEMS